ncbi:MAG TPA: T9SS type A sorting domain-containing protein [Bacteroidia bacterium]|nr:T9SS type A sorting domain-containing protein [Bacteroidia bacterium]
MKRKLFVVLLSLSAAFLVSAVKTGVTPAKTFHTAAEKEMLTRMALTPIGPGDYFLTSASCSGCHGFDTLNQSNINEDGIDVNLFDRWQGSMMANSAKDPLWRAKVSHEIMVNPAHASALQDKCTACHAPMGHYNAFYKGNSPFLISDLINDSLGLDGVSCAGCHTIGPGAGSTFSGIIPYDTTRTIYGPFTNPFFGPMQLYEGYTPTYSPHMDQSAVCSACHTLITESVDLSGNFTGGEFIEQATYHEYLNSSYPAANIKCQTCHMPHEADPIVIANGFMNLQPRFPFNQHYFAGANHFMVELIKNNKTALGISTHDANFDSTLAATSRMLRENSVSFQLISDSITADTGYFRVKVLNKAGHKFPSGYPSRRAVLQLLMTDATGDTVFQSGIFDAQYRVVGETVPFEPHHRVINQNNESQIYEMVMGDVNSQITTVLERAAILLKDNRIPPDGFTTTSAVYDTVTITPDALADSDFNQLAGTEGTGSDFVGFHIPVTGVTGNVSVFARLFYQSVPPKWTDEMFLMNSAPIDTFRNMFLAADQTPFQVAEDSLMNLVLTGIGNPAATEQIQLIQNNSDGSITIITSGERIKRITVYDITGKRLLIINGNGTNRNNFRLTETTGIYFISAEGDETKATFKLFYKQ